MSHHTMRINLTYKRLFLTTATAVVLLGQSACQSGGRGGVTPLIEAARTDRPSELRDLLAAGAEVNAVETRDGSAFSTPLLYAVSRGDRSSVELLLENGADPELPGWRGLTPFMEAARMGHPQVLEILQRRAVSVNAVDEDGRTALIWAALTGRPQSVQYLVRIPDLELDLRDLADRSALDYARESGRTEIVRLLENAGAGS